MIRPFTRDDISACVALGAEMHKESRYASLDYDPLKLMELGHQIVENPDVYWAVVAEVDGEIVGIAAGYVVEHFFGHDLTSSDLLIYVAREHRKGMLGVKFIKQYDAWCKSKGVKHPMLGVSAGIMPERIGRLYQRLGYADTYTIYVKP